MPGVTVCVDTSRLYLNNTTDYIMKVRSVALGTTVNIYDINPGTEFYKTWSGGDWISASGDTMTVVYLYNQKNPAQYFKHPLNWTGPKLVFNATPSGKAAIEFERGKFQYLVGTTDMSLSNVLAQGSPVAYEYSTYYSAMPRQTPQPNDPTENLAWTGPIIYGEESGGRHFGVHHTVKFNGADGMWVGTGQIDPREIAENYQLDQWFYGGFDYATRTWTPAGYEEPLTYKALTSYVNGEYSQRVQGWSQLSYAMNYTLEIGGSGGDFGWFDGLLQGYVVLDQAGTEEASLAVARNMYNYYQSDVNGTATASPTPTLTVTMTTTPTPTVTPTFSATYTSTATVTYTATITPTSTITGTSTATPTVTVTPTITVRTPKLNPWVQPPWWRFW
jgi:hypothetical protein